MSIFSPKHISPIGIHFDGDLVSAIQLSGPPHDRKVVAAARATLPLGDDGSLDSDAAGETFGRLFGDHAFKGRHAVTALGPTELFIQNVRLPDIPRVEWPAALRSESSERLPFPAEEAEIRFLPAGEFRQDGETKQEVVLFASHRPGLEQIVKLCQRAGAVLERVDTVPTAVLRAQYDPTGESDGRWATIDFGRGGATVAFAKGDHVLFAKFLPCSGQELDDAVAAAMNLSAPEARTMRETVTEAEQLDPSDDLHRTVIGAIRKPLERLANEVELCLRYFKVAFRGKPVDMMTVAGSEASPWLTEYLGTRLGLDCRIAEPFATQHVTHRLRSGRPANWTAAIGLALAEPLTDDARAETFVAEPRELVEA
ncbi:pilus assembly protein PilM [Stratiformator vulcanicus]|uniref:Competence protein A n=1 Tax=Stratiformator vulcanicus TaxID=2527980 RepID=A0A517R510_9PLAN|nr:pilus assembly protein PilM [Stratiformator vulcanicus]QDT38975.1 Competence protein A [Stratiformator vulcanicus]